MKHRYLIVMAFLIITSGCETIIQPPTPRAFVAEISSTMTQAGIETATFVNSTPIASITPNPGFINNENTELIFRDDFNEKLEPGWEWPNEDPASWSLVNEPGALQIQSEFGYINFGTAKNLLLRNTPTDDFYVETSLNFSPDENDQFAGIVLLASEKDFIQSGLGYCAPAVGCIERGFYSDVYKNGNLKLPRNVMHFAEDIISIRLVVQNGTLSIFSSPNGKVWYRIMEQSLDFVPVKAGLFTGQNSYPVIIPATFEYFEIRTFQK